MITPLDIEKKEFSKGVRGYKEREVEEFLNEILTDFETLYSENSQLKEEIQRVKEEMEKYQNIEETLKNTLVVAQNTADEVKRNANKEAQLILDKAENDAKLIVEKAKRDQEKIEQQHEEAKKQMNIFKVRCKTLLESQLSTILDADFNQEDEID
ncbi:DivIVA domain-containing protein [Isachenkonia alkalipeptolytica]|uniref:DivIVA domain-containing protein n=1 Tax=Isachenkonia alkalipeptolytica TaxID=2565777 RepID=A0AA43XMH2_9CLOT|nr:DivIVA domain-containing protein [Isachenkonia alkalipeptolytica]NBG89146.1 DivIVA domain-containing protein [Isachenkonia alkalipeptolytica]